MKLDLTTRLHRHRPSHPIRQARIEVLEARIAPAAAFAQLADPHAAPGNHFGETILALRSGNVVVTAPFDDAGGVDAGAVYLFNGQTGALISTLIGSHDGDHLGLGGVTGLSNGNFVVESADWNASVGAATWGSGTVGVSGVLSAANSLVGSAPGDQVGSDGVKALSYGNYVVVSTGWSGAVGAVTWGSGTSGVSGEISAGNSLVGSAAGDRVGGDGVTELSNGSYVVSSVAWGAHAGAVTWGSGTAGVTGAVSAANSLVGSTADDFLGSSGVFAVSSGNYVVSSPHWHDHGAAFVGAVTWGSGTAGVSGVVSAANSLVGSMHGDEVGLGSTEVDPLGSGGVTVLSNGNYVVNSPYYSQSANSQLTGAVTWGSGTAGVTGAISAANSLLGGSQLDQIGNGGVVALSNGNYVVLSPFWYNAGNPQVGAATWGDGTAGVSGFVSEANSLVGSTALDHVGSSGAVTELSNGNYVVASPEWDNGSADGAGAVTWGSGTAGVHGAVGAANSLVGSTGGDHVGGSVTALSNGHYVVASPLWDNGSAADAGAVTWGSGTAGVSGAVSEANSLVGSTVFDQVGSGGVTVLSNGHYVVVSPQWDNGSANAAGAVTWGSGTAGVHGAVGAANSLVGSTVGDYVGGLGVTVLSNGNYVVRSPIWDNGAVRDAGAVTWGSGTAGVSGAVSAANSLVGSTAGDIVGNDGVTALSNGNYVVGISSWTNGQADHAGAVTWGSGTTGVSGPVSVANSLVGSSANDFVGGGRVTALSNGNYVVDSSSWANGATADAGAVTWGSGTAGVSGVITAANSLVGISGAEEVGRDGVTALSNGNYLVHTADWDHGALANAGAVTFGDGGLGVKGPITFANSARGLTADTSLGDVIADPVNATLFLPFLTEGGGVIRVGSQIDGFAPAHTLPLDVHNPVIFFDHNHDKVTVRLSGLGTGTVILEGGVLDGADLSEIAVANAAKSTLSITVTKDRLHGDGLVRLGEVSVAGALLSFSGPAVDFSTVGLHSTGAVQTITAHSLLAGGIVTDGLVKARVVPTFVTHEAVPVGAAATDKLALNFGGTLGADGRLVLSTPQTISALKAGSVGAGEIHAAALTSISVTAGGLAAGVTSAGAIGSLTVKGGGVSGGLTAASFGAVSITGGSFTGSLTSTATAETLGKTKALTSLSVTTGSLSGDVNLLGTSGAITDKTGGLSGHLTAASFGAVSVTGGAFSGSITSTATAVTLGTTKALTSLTVTTGSLTGDVDLLGASGAITVKTGGLSGHLAAASFGAVAVTGGDFSGTLTSLTPAATLGRTKALTSLTVTDGNLTGDIRLLGASGAITVKSKPALGGGDMTGASIVASAIASLTVGRDLTSSIVLAGADLGDDYAFGGSSSAGDTFAAGTIGAVKIGRNVSGVSVIGAGFSNVDGMLRSADDAILGAALSSIASLTITGTADAGSYFAAGAFKVAPKIARAVVPTSDPRFFVG